MFSITKIVSSSVDLWIRLTFKMFYAATLSFYEAYKKGVGCRLRAKYEIFRSFINASVSLWNEAINVDGVMPSKSLNRG